MDFIKNIGRLLLDYYDKIVLGLLLAGLACVMVQQSCSMQETSRYVQEARLPQNPPRGKIKELDMAQFDLKIEVDPADTWQPVSRVTRDETYQIPGISVALRSYLLNFGETSLYDPAVYVYSSHKADFIVHYDTRINPSTGLSEVDPTDTTVVKPGDDDDDSNPPPPAAGKLIERVRLYKVQQQSFPAVLRRITTTDPTDKSTWMAQVDVYEPNNRKKSLFVRLGDALPIAGHKPFKVVDMDYQLVPDNQGIKREVSSVTLREGDDADQKITLVRNQSTRWGGAVYRLVVLPPVDPPQRPYAITVEPNKPFVVKMGFPSGTRQEIYRVVEQVGDTLKVVEQGDEQKTYEVRPFSRADLDKYRSSSPGTSDPGMEEEPMPEPTPE